MALKSWTNFKLEQCCTNVNLQGLDKLKDPFLDTLSNYDESRQTVVELTWDQTQTDVSLVTSVHDHDHSDQSDTKWYMLEITSEQKQYSSFNGIPLLKNLH